MSMKFLQLIHMILNYIFSLKTNYENVFTSQQKNDQELPKKNIFTTSKVEHSAYFKLFWKFLIITSKKVKINEILAGKG